MTTDTKTLIEAVQRLAESIESIDGVANAVIFEAAQRLKELQTALQSAHASLVLARNERDEALVEVEERKDALLDAAKQIDELKKQRDVWLHKARRENEKLLNVRVELEGIRNVISNAGFSDVLDPLERVTRLIRERDEAIKERTPHDYGILKDQRDSYRDRLCASIKETQEAHAEVERVKKALHDALAEISRLEKMTPVISHSATRPDPSRLEIAAMIMAGGVTGSCGRDALCYADALIAESKKAK
jgi:chromosome segregation ATPase